MGRIIFITGTDTGVGKTVVTATMAHFARAAGMSVAALKPLCTGERTDAVVLSAVTGAAPEAINPWYFPEPVSPWTAGRNLSSRIALQDVASFLRKHEADLIMVEGAGGVLTPLGDNFSARDLIRELACETVLVCPNRLGVLNHALLSLEALGRSSVKIALVESPEISNDASLKSNAGDLRELAAPVPVIRFPWLSGLRDDAESISRNAKAATEAVRDLLA